MRLFIMFRKNDEGKLVVNRISVRPDAKEVTPKFITQELADKFVSDVTTYREAFSLFGNEYSYLRTSHSHSVVYSIWVDDYDGAIVRFYVTLPTPLYDNPIKRLTTLHPPEETEAQA